jgi:hypothetical protein
VSRKINEDIRTSLITLRDAIKNVDDTFKTARDAFNTCRANALLSVGIQGDALKFALDQAKDYIKAGKPAGPTERLEVIENAIGLFTLSDGLAIPEL